MNSFEERKRVSPPVLTRALEMRATEQVTEQDLARFRAKWTAAASGVVLATARTNTMIVKKRKFAVKILSAAAAVAIIFLGVTVMDMQQFSPIEKGDAALGGATVSKILFSGGNEAAAAEVAAALEKIEFTGGECECGHENPDGAHIKGDEEAMIGWDISWEIKPSGSTKAIFAGEGTAVSSAFSELKNENRNGTYTLFFYMEDGKHYTITMDREFVIST
ncbi:MAG: hypothetical protein LBN12_08295 [Clostridiales Family XIII bacterium]|nr:hypothetical protein [Clostridiales Family XIII bacterium]